MWHTPRPPSQPGAPADRTVYVVERGFHTDIGLRSADLTGPIAQFATIFPTAQTVLFGFGDRLFVTTRRKWLGDWLLALVPGHGAMLVTGLLTTPDVAFGQGNVARIKVTSAQLARIEAYVSFSFDLAGGMPVWIGKGPYYGSLFYASPRTYDLLDTCNTWTAAALRSGGLNEGVAFTLLSGQAMRGARRLAKGTE
jgi:uncharacterized protein (TIGR02117 family)